MTTTTTPSERLEALADEIAGGARLASDPLFRAQVGDALHAVAAQFADLEDHIDRLEGIAMVADRESRLARQCLNAMVTAGAEAVDLVPPRLKGVGLPRRRRAGPTTPDPGSGRSGFVPRWRWRSLLFGGGSMIDR